ncbi:FAR-17a/AIG1-like protein [Pisolithus marmoratus]|nr:FAR-17a/AIG1-like protein [Pisolithus marmoratus]
MSRRRGRAFVAHILSACAMGHGLMYTERNPIDKTVANRISEHKSVLTLYLTIQALVASWVYIVLSLIQDMFPMTRRYLHPLKRALSMVFLPMGFVVSSVYWSLRLFAPSLILFPAEISPTSPTPVHGLVKLPLLADIAMHLAPMLSLLTDFVFFEPKFSARQMAIAPIIMIAYAVVYATAVEYFASQNGFFPYPFLDASSLPIRLAIYVGASCIGLGCLMFLNRLHSARW